MEQNGKSIQATAGTVYSVDVDQKLLVSAVPLKDNYNTTFSIEYKTTGVKDDTAPIFLKLEEHKVKIDAKLGVSSTGLSTKMIAIIVGSAVVLIGLIFFCIMKCRQAKNHEKMTELHDNMENTVKSTPLPDDSRVSDHTQNDPYSPEGKLSIKTK